MEDLKTTSKILNSFLGESVELGEENKCVEVCVGQLLSCQILNQVKLLDDVTREASEQKIVKSVQVTITLVMFFSRSIFSNENKFHISLLFISMLYIHIVERATCELIYHGFHPMLSLFSKLFKILIEILEMHMIENEKCNPKRIISDTSKQQNK